eukprot:357124-Chlamydomonas_euryale.AAC.7
MAQSKQPVVPGIETACHRPCGVAGLFISVQAWADCRAGRASRLTPTPLKRLGSGRRCGCTAPCALQRRRSGSLVNSLHARKINARLGAAAFLGEAGKAGALARASRPTA